jgi:sugar lactone lactonase YvrE
MKRFALAWMVAVVALGDLGLSAAETGKLRHVVSVYFDSKGAGLSLPEGVACDSSGQFVVGDTGNDRLVRFTFRDKAVTDGTEIKIPQVSAPSRVRLNSKGDIYALDSRLRRVVHLGPGGEFKEAVAFTGVPEPSTIVAKDFTIDAADNLYVLDVFSARVLVVSPQGQFQKALPLPGDGGFGSNLAVDSTNTLLLLDAINRRMYSAAKDAAAFTPLGGDLTQFIATLPSYMTASKGGILIVEGNGSSIVGFGRDGSFLSRQLSMGWNEGSLNHPSQMCINDKDEVFIADRDNSRIQVFQLMR